jgi:hypothetical protein
MFDTGSSQSFAHNLVLSFLQMAGLLALPFLIIVARWTLIAARRRPELLPAIAAGLSLSITEPFFEGFVGALVMWMVLYPLTDRSYLGSMIRESNRFIAMTRA